VKDGPLDVSELPIFPIRTAGGFHFLSGVVGLATNKALVEGGIEAELTQIFKLIEKILSKHGSKMTDIVETTVFLVDEGDFRIMNRHFTEAFRDENLMPTRTTAGATWLPMGAKAQIAVIAVAHPNEPSDAKLREKQAHDKGRK